MRMFSVMCIVCLIIMIHFVTLQARPVPRSIQATGQEQPQLPLVARIEDDFENTMGARGGMRMRRILPQVPPHTPRRILSEKESGVSSEKPKPRGNGLINCDPPNGRRAKLIDELYCEALSLANREHGGVLHYRIHRLPT